MKSESLVPKVNVIEPTKSYKRVYVWEIPVRIFHWGNALAITVLCVTGFIIGDPPALMSQHEAWNSFWFGTVKMIHFISAYVFLVVMIMRVYWSFVGNRYSDWRAFIPTNKKAFQNIMHVIKYDVLLLKDPHHRLSDISIGHNYMATVSYVIMFFVALVLIFTGFGMYSNLSGWWFPQMFSWVPSLVGGDFNLRILHRISMWLIILFVMIHVYLVLFHDWLHARGEVSTMISGFKFVRTERVAAEEKTTGEILDSGAGIGHEIDYIDEDNPKGIENIKDND